MTQPPFPPLGIGLIGLGRHGSRYAKHILNDLPEARLVAVSRRRATEGSGLPSASAIPCYSDYHDLIDDPHVQAVVVVTPPALNRDICLAVAGARKALLVEKPLAITAAEARLIAGAARESRQVTMTAQTLRFDATVAALIERQATIGALHYLSLVSRMEPHGFSEEVRGFGDRGCLLEIGIHLLDLIRVLTNDEVLAVSCDMDIVPPRGAERRLFGRFTTTRGLVALVDASRVSSGRIGRIELIGTEGQLSADWCARKIVQVSEQHGNVEWSTVADPTVLNTLRAFVRAVRECLPPSISIEDGKRAVEIAEACYASAKSDGSLVRVEYA
ncbi:MAG TPA: Gfo/Idh/MocA family oxidoreductase [Nitrospira sp.]|jgi:predicted dehydrogenase|nr:Gfo/Idh/MocA family oxidoreductase [Nitrospira sp.]